MLLCASSKEGKEEGGVEFVLPPEGSQPGERVFFEGKKYEGKPFMRSSSERVLIYVGTGAQPEAQLNPKKKIFETIQPVSHLAS